MKNWPRKQEQPKTQCSKLKGDRLTLVKVNNTMKKNIKNKLKKKCKRLPSTVIAMILLKLLPSMKMDLEMRDGEIILTYSGDKISLKKMNLKNQWFFLRSTLR